MRVVKVPIASADTGFRCRFCDEDVSHSARQCPNCGIPYPAKEAMGQRFLYRLVAIVICLGSVGWIVGFIAGSWVLRVLGAVAGIALGLVVTRWVVGRGEVRMQTHAFLRLNPEAMNWTASQVANRLGTPATSVVSRALGEARKST